MTNIVILQGNIRRFCCYGYARTNYYHDCGANTQPRVLDEYDHGDRAG